MKDWEDVEGWNTFHSENYRENGWVNNGFLFTLVETLIDRKNVRNVWFPGCGTSYVPKIFTELGFNIWVTDVSDFAIAIQHELTQKSAEQIGMGISVENEQGELESYTIVDYCRKNYSFAGKQGTFNVEKHDFRTPFHHVNFDCIVNMRAFQGFSTNTQRQIAKVHYDALKLGGLAVLETQNVVGNAGLELESSLLDAGFHIQGFKSYSWFWNTLSEILPPDLLRDYGSVARDYFWSVSERQKYSKTLEELKQEFSQRREQELEETVHLLNDGETKVAQVESWTG